MKKYRAKGKNIKELLPKVAEKLGVEVEDLDYEIKTKKKKFGLITTEIEIVVWLKEDIKSSDDKTKQDENSKKVELKKSVDNFKKKDDLIETFKEDGELYVILKEGEIEYTEFLDYVVLFDIEEPIMENLEKAYENRGEKYKVGKIYEKVEDPTPEVEEEDLEIHEGEIDEKINISYSKDKMEGYIEFKDQDVIKKLSVEKIIELLNKEGIVFGILEDKIKNILKLPKIQEELLVAKGKPVVSGEDGYIDYKIESIKNKNKLTGELLENGSINFKELHLIDNVLAGDVLAKNIPETMGEDGKNVLGETLVAKSGKPAKLKSGKNTKWDENSQVISEIDGMVKLVDKNKIEVLKVYETKGVNIETGNVEFNGNVIVNGDVDPGYEIRAKGNIEITGNVEKGNLMADGDIIVMGSIFGKHEGKIIAKGDIMANFVEAVTLEAGGDIVANEALMNTKAMANGSIKVIDKKGVVLGGELKASDHIEIKNLGSTRGAKTNIEVGENPKIKERLTKNKTEIEKLEEKDNSIDKNLKILHTLKEKLKEQMPPDKEALLQKLSKAKLSIRTHLKELNDKVEQDTEMLNKSHEASVKVYGTCYPGSKIHMRKGTFRIKDEMKNIKFYYKNGKIKTKSLR
ncbi:MAG: DUF342 domain-containing protein [Fusobacteriota bacterium]